jgi:hypothetical protein
LPMILDILFILMLTALSLYFVAHTSSQVPRCRHLFYRSLLFHTSISVFFCFFMTYNSDAGHYYTVAKDFVGDLSALNMPGTKFISLICYPFANSMGLSYLSVTLVFNLFGFVGLCYFYRSIYEQVRSSRKTVRYLDAFLFIPGLSFWTCSVGKDSLIFMGLGILMFSLSRLKNRVMLFFLALAIVFCARPQIFILIIASLVLSFLFSRNFLSLRSLLIFGGILAVGLYTKDMILARFGVADISNNVALQEYLDSRAQYNLEGGSSVDISQYGFFMKSFTYLYRPLFFDARNVTMLLSSLENLLYLCLTLHLLFKLPLLKLLKERRQYVNFVIPFFFMMLFVLSSTTANLGIAVRQKTMFMPLLLALYCLSFARRKRERGKRRVQPSPIVRCDAGSCRLSESPTG